MFETLRVSNISRLRSFCIEVKAAVVEGDGRELTGSPKSSTKLARSVAHLLE